tara:strand:- start:1980 stop:2243 length:264 start_codon:yes stop_codon:yes gene_type:complete
MNIEGLITALKEGIVTVEFKKLDTGEIRIMPCTLNSELAKHTPRILNFDHNSDTIVMWAIDKKAWRDVRVNTIIRWYAGTPINFGKQ